MFDFTHTEQELRLILAGLEELPHKVSRQLIDKLVNGAVAQQPAPSADAAATPASDAPSADSGPDVSDAPAAAG